MDVEQFAESSVVLGLRDVVGAYSAESWPPRWRWLFWNRCAGNSDGAIWKMYAFQVTTGNQMFLIRF